MDNTNNQQSDTTVFGYALNGVCLKDRYNSHMHSNDKFDPSLISEAVKEISIDWPIDDKRNVTVNFDKPIGLCNCIEVKENDPRVQMVQRKGRKGPTPVIKEAEPVLSDKLTMCILRINETESILLTAYVGEAAPPEPWDEHIETEEERAVSRAFWSSHAFIITNK